MKLLTLGALALPFPILTTVMQAQSTIVSPIQSTAAEGNSNQAFPFNSPVVRRYQQIHSDIGGQPRVITKLSFRQNAGNTTAFTGTWACDMEMSMGQSVAWDQASFVFSQNYIGSPLQVFARRVINLGPLGQNSTTGPLPFTVDIPLDVPFVYIGVNSLIWDVSVHSNVLTGTFNQYDAEGCSSTSASTSITGTGCIATGQTAGMTHLVSAIDRAGALLFYATVTNAPPTAMTLLALGGTNPNVPVPGLCGNLLTDLAATINLGFSSATGTITVNEGFGLVFSQNIFVGATLFTQALSLDPGRIDPIQFSLSNGRATVFPSSNLSNVVQASRIYNSVGGTGSLVASPVTTSIGYAVVTQFTY